jgi:hypothetical protein
MASDRARSTYDRAKQYRRVVPQQGRVVLEADLNEASEIAAEEARQQLLDVVGAFGVPRDPRTQSPGNGYALGVDPAGDLTIGAGTVYVGGLRVEQEDPALLYSKQHEGLEGPALERALPRAEEEHPHGVAHLYLREQEVSATEDTTLLDVALGGPDTAQRVRLVRKVVVSRASSPHLDAVGEVLHHLGKSGYVLDPNDLRLGRTARLHVNRRALEEADEPRGHLPRRSYLGAENQLIRIQVSSSKKTILWGYDNGSSLYRADLAEGTKTNLTLRSTPVDEHHEPRAHQVVEVLEATALLPEGNAVAAVCGAVRRLTTAYDPATQTITLDEPIHDGWARTKLFVRVWENEHPFEPGKPVLLVDSRGRPVGIDVTLTQAEEPEGDAGAARDSRAERERFVPGDFWSFAVRPMEPTRIDPPRYREPQPPEGPREWLAPLALLDFGKRKIHDLRPSFESLVRLDQRTENEESAGRGDGKHVSRIVTVTEEELTGSRSLRTVIEEHVAELEKGIRVTIVLEPGTYVLHAPIRLGFQHSGLTIEGRGARLEARFAEEGGEHLFIDGFIIATDARDLTFRGLTFTLGWAAFQPSWLNLNEVEQRHRGARGLTALRSSIGIRVVNCSDLAIEDCRFFFPSAGRHHAFGAAIFAAGECRGLTVTDNRFEAPEPPRGADGNRDASFTHTVFGYLLTPSICVTEWALAPDGILAKKGTVLRSLLTEATFHGNVFSGMAAAVLVLASLGTVRIERNRVRESYGGFWLFSLGTMPLWGSSGDARELGHTHIAPALFEILGVVQDPIVQLGIALAQWTHTPLAGAAEDILADHAVLPKLRSGLLDPLSARAQSWLGERLFEVALVKANQEENLEGLSVTAIAIASSAVAVSSQASESEAGPFSLRLTDNDVIVRRKGEERSGAGLIIWATDGDPEATVIVSTNQVRNSSLAHAALMMLTVAQGVVSANVVVNEARAGSLPEGWLERRFPMLAAVRSALGLHPHTRLGAIILPHHGPDGTAKDPVAITGNVFGGENSFPKRPDKLPAWATYNSTV